MDFCQVDAEEASSAALAVEQTRVSAMYERLDALRAHTADQLATAHMQERGGFAALVERETRSYEQARRQAQLGSVEEGLCFGRIDLVPEEGNASGEGPETRYVGRIGLRDAEYGTILVDWRAPAARPFYAATPGDPHGITRRRHLRVRRRRVVGLDDDVFDPGGLTDTDRRQLVGEAALLASLHQGRTGRMGDIVATIQTEQDRVIRARMAGVLVVQGGPGTGKTVAALHRAAYLLYTHRNVLERRGVLVVGPNPAFLRYVSDVLPALGETDVVMRTVGELFPGVTASAHDPHATAAVKSSLGMVDLLHAAVADRQRTPEEALGGEDLLVETDAGVLTVSGALCEHVLRTARGLRLSHNIARKYVVNTLLGELARSESTLLGRPVAEEDLSFSGERLWHEEPVREALDGLWPYLTPRRLLRELFADPAALERVGARAGIGAEACAALARSPESPWTVEDVPLLDEAAELLGHDDSAERARERRAEAERDEEERYAQGVLEFTGLFEDQMMDAAGLAARHRDTGPARTTADRAGSDREWTYGHVIVDEAQELSPMAWRTVMRRVPTRSLTVVGDVAQTGSASGTRSWLTALDPYARGKVHVERLRVNYRTPAPIMAVAADVLREAAPDEEVPESVRGEGDPPRAVRLSSLEGELSALVDGEVRTIGAGRVAVVTADRHVDTVAAALPTAARPGAGGSGTGRDALEETVVVLTATEAKGLEFDSVVVVEPDALLAQPRGANDLYVAVTRATRRLTVAHTGELPDVLGRLA
ncbi:HelD family protein [Nocardiopsis quinghaiensis]|uniref:HelD family protein n=1 Tax=Nocardiopsis quinghaiensis TaxID=464995 RepID=UPI00123BEEEC|nr:ATP-binding domain-containing protein [Nocardiopsis quinghaiensis]